MFYKLVDYSWSNPIQYHGGPDPLAYAELDFHRLVDVPARRRLSQAAPKGIAKPSWLTRPTGLQLKVSIQLYVIQAYP